MARQGLNCTLSYQRGGANHTYRIRCAQITHGIQMLGEESQARMVRSFYPHRTTTQKFYIGVLIKGYKEHKSLTKWLMEYVSYALDPNFAGSFRAMDVRVPDREFKHKGIPLSGFFWGDTVGKVLWNTTLEFEAAYEPWDQSTPNTSAIDNLTSVYEKEKAAKYWYPEGIQLSGEEKPVDYDKIIRDFSERWSGNNAEEDQGDAGPPGPTGEGFYGPGGASIL